MTANRPTRKTESPFDAERVTGVVYAFVVFCAITGSIVRPMLMDTANANLVPVVFGAGALILAVALFQCRRRSPTADAVCHSLPLPPAPSSAAGAAVQVKPDLPVVRTIYFILAFVLLWDTGVLFASVAWTGNRAQTGSGAAVIPFLLVGAGATCAALYGVYLNHLASSSALELSAAVMCPGQEVKAVLRPSPAWPVCPW